VNMWRNMTVYQYEVSYVGNDLTNKMRIETNQMKGSRSLG